MSTKRPVDYISNKDLLESLKDYKARVSRAEENGEEPPRVPEEIGLSLYRIATRLATKPNFSGYSYKDEMIADALENCVRYLLNFDHGKSENPFAYFTQIIKNAFIRRIKKEQRQQYFKMKSVQDVNLESILQTNAPVCRNLMTTSSEFVCNYEKREKGS